MIDFRYHLVSLVAVFLALALGIVLGAGPLAQPIGDQLTGQVEELREDRDRLRTDLDVSRQAVENRDTFIDEVAPATLGSRLEGRSVAVVALPGAVADDVTDVRRRLEQAGAVVTGQVQVTEAWTDPATATVRASLAGQLLGYLAPVPGDGADPGVILGTALGQALTRGDAENVPVDDARTLLELLVSADSPLVEVVDEPQQVANATVVIGPRSEEIPEVEEVDEARAEERQQRLREEVALSRGLALTAEGSVVAGSATAESDLVSVIRSDDAAAQTVTTTDSISDVAGRVSVPMALAVAISGVVDHYGFAPDATTAVPPPVYLPPPAPPADPGDAGASGEGRAPTEEGDEPVGGEDSAADDATAGDGAADDATTDVGALAGARTPGEVA